ncbi:MAG: alpha/beta hydrolase [Gemmatimonadaceae bacterium]|nr:alpha/beta hydrolase [Gemmatimonadaceae bacterium]
MIRSGRRGRLPPEKMFPSEDANFRTSFSILASGIRVRVVEIGAPAAPPVVMIPGWGCPVYIFRKTLPALADAGYRAIAFDVKGSGLSDKPVGEKEYSVAALVEHLREVLDALALDAPAVVGHSRGASLAFHFAAQYPSRVRALGLLAPVGLTGLPLWRLYKALTPNFLDPLFRRVSPRFVVKLALRRVYGKRGVFTEADVDQYWAPTQFPEYAVALRDALHAYDWKFAARNPIPQLSVPAVGIWGDRDHLMPSDGMAIYAKAIPGITLHRVTGVGHIVTEEGAGIVASGLRAMLDAAG